MYDVFGMTALGSDALPPATSLPRINFFTSCTCPYRKPTIPYIYSYFRSIPILGE
jgi:hypothetical protein